MKKLLQVVARHILDHFAARADDPAIRQFHLHADHVITDGSAAEAPRPAHIVRENVRSRSPLRRGGIDGQPLPVPAQLRLQLGQRHRARNCGRHVGRSMFDIVAQAAICFFGAKSEQRLEPGKILCGLQRPPGSNTPRNARIASKSRG